MKPITRKEYYLAKAAGTYTGPTPPPVLREDYYLATLAGDYSGNCPAPVTRLERYMSAAAGLTSYVPQPVTRLEMYWYNIAKGTGYVPEPATREEQLLYAIIHKEPQCIDKTAEGSTILLTDSAEAPLTALTVYGHSTQDGTPSPDNPVPIVSAGDSGEINVSVSDGGTQSQTLTLSTPGGLPGVPVDSGGNYTDESGQQWICDEIDLKRGKYVKRVEKIVIDGEEMKFTPGGAGVYWNLPEHSAEGIIYLSPIMSMYFPHGVFSVNNAYDFIYTMTMLIGSYFSSVNDLNEFCTEKSAEGQPLELYYGVDPIETDLPAEEIAAYQALRTYSPTTTVSNDAEAWMEVGYKATP